MLKERCAVDRARVATLIERGARSALAAVVPPAPAVVVPGAPARFARYSADGLAWR